MTTRIPHELVKQILRFAGKLKREGKQPHITAVHGGDSDEVRQRLHDLGDEIRESMLREDWEKHHPGKERRRATSPKL